MATQQHEPRSYVLVCMGGIDVHERRVDARRIATGRLHAKQWPLYENTAHTSAFQPNDRVLVYIGGAGEAAQTFIGQAKFVRVVDAPTAWADAAGSVASGVVTSIAHLTDVEIWDEPVSIREHLDGLKFIKNRSRWGLHLMGGVREIPKEDYDKIVRAGGR